MEYVPPPVADATPIEDEAGWMPAQRPIPETSFLENVRATREEMRFIGNTNAENVQAREAYGPIIEALEQAGARWGNGRHFLNPASLPDEPTQAYNTRVPGRAEMEQMIFQELARRPGFLPEVPRDHAEFRRQVTARNAERLQRIRTVQAGGGLGGQLVGGVLGSFEDPVNLWTMPFGGSSRTFVGALARAAIENAAVEAISQPFIMGNYAELGEEYGLTDALRNVLFAGGAGAAFRGGAEGVSRGASALALVYDRLVTEVFEAMPEPLQRRWADAATVDDVLLTDLLRTIHPEGAWEPELRAAVNVLERDAEIRGASPFEPGPVGDEAHSTSLAQSLQNIIAGAPPVRVDVPLPSVTTVTRPGAATVVPRGRDTGNRIASDVVDYLTANGIDPNVARGIAAGVSAESRNDHTARNPTSGAFGLGQWLGSRRRELFRRYGDNPSRQQQLEFLLWELRGGDHGGAAVLAARDPHSALDAYIRRFMRPAAGAETTGDLSRGASALAAEAPPGAARTEPAEMVAAPASDDARVYELEAELAAREANEGGAFPDEPDLAVPFDAVPTLRRDMFANDNDWGEAQEALYRRYTDDLGPEPQRPRTILAHLQDVLATDSQARGVRTRISAQDAIENGVPAEYIFIDPSARYPVVKQRVAGVFASTKAPLRSRGVPTDIVSLDQFGDRLDPSQWGIEGRTGRLEPEVIGSLLRDAFDGSDRSLNREDPNYDRWVEWQGRAADIEDMLARAEAGENMASLTEEYGDALDRFAAHVVQASARPDVDPFDARFWADWDESFSDAGPQFPRAGGAFDPEGRAGDASQPGERGTGAAAGRGGAEAELARFDDPTGEGPRTAADSIEHDLRADLAADPELSAKRFLIEETGEQSLDEILDDIDQDRAAVAALRGCL